MDPAERSYLQEPQLLPVDGIADDGQVLSRQTRHSSDILQLRGQAFPRPRHSRRGATVHGNADRPLAVRVEGFRETVAKDAERKGVG